MFIIHSQRSLGVKSEVVGGVECDKKMEKFFSSLSSSKKIGREKKKTLEGIWRGFFFSALITGLLSDRSLSKSYKLEGGGWNRD